MYLSRTICKVFCRLNVILNPIILKIQYKIGKDNTNYYMGAEYVLCLIDTFQSIFYNVYQMEQGSHLSSINSLVSYIDHFS